MQVLDQKRIALLSLMGMAEGDLDARYHASRVMVERLEEDGWFGGSGKSSKPSTSSSKQDLRSKELASKRQVQRILDLDDTRDVTELEALSKDEARDLIAELK